MAQLDTQAADVADDSVDSASATDTGEIDTAGQSDPDTLDVVYPDDGPRESDEPDEDDDADPDDDDVGDDDADDDGEPAIAPPSSWKADEKAAFAKLPREVQETVTRREAERERFVQSKAQEAAQARQAVTQEAFEALAQIRAQQAQELDQIAAQITPQRPSPRLMAEDPDLYADQMEAYEYWSAQRQQVQQTAQQRQLEAESIKQQIAQQQAAHEAQQARAILSEKFPEYLDEERGPKLREELGSIAMELGYPAELLTNVDATDILAMRTALQWKTDAAKWRALQSRKMADVRAGKSKQPPPRTARPGAAGSNRARAPKDTLAILYPND